MSSITILKCAASKFLLQTSPSVSVFYDLRTDIIVSGMYMNKEDSDNINEDTRSCPSTYKKLSYTSFSRP